MPRLAGTKGVKMTTPADETAFTVDGVLGGRLRIRQPVDGYRAAIDPVLLAAAVPAKAGEQVLDVGCGVGTAGLCLATRVDGVRVSGIDLQRDLAALAAANARDNGLAGRVDFMAGDLLRPPPRLAAGTYDHIMANPPFVAAGRGNPPPDPGKAVAAVEGEARLADWLRFCLAMVRPKGSVTVVHRADRLDELLALMRQGLGALTVFPLWPGGTPAADGRPKPAKRIIVSGRKGIAAPLSLLPGLVLHTADGTYTDEAERVLRDGAALTS